MKKNLRLQLKALAQKIIDEENNLTTASLKKTARELYERFVVLEYLESQLHIEKEAPAEQSLDSKSFREENWFTEPEPLPQQQNREDLIEPLMEKIKDIVAQMPKETQHVDDLMEEVLPSKKYVNNDLEEFANNYQQTPTFERKEPSKGGNIPVKNETAKFPQDFKTRSVNDNFQQGLNVGLNDRLAFIKHLFNGDANDYTRVLSQINTKTSFEEASNFIKTQVKPDYNYWLQKEEYAERFMNIVEKRFN